MGKAFRLLSQSVRAKWRELQQLETAISEPGFIGPIPYLLVLRLAVITGIITRFILHKEEYQGHLWTWTLIAIGFAVVLAGVAIYVTRIPELRRSRKLNQIFVALDILCISFFYWWTDNTQSDFFLFYYLPIFYAAEYIGNKAVLIASAGVTGSFASVIALLYFANPGSEGTPIDLFLRVFFPREVFFVLFVVTSAFLLRRERVQRQRISQQNDEIQTLSEFRDEVDHLFDVDAVLELMIDTAVCTLNSVGAHTTLINYETKQIESKAYTRKNYFRDDSAFVKAIDAIDKITVEKKLPRYIKQVSSRPQLSEIFEPQVHSLICVPIIAHETVLGTLTVAISEQQTYPSVERFLIALAEHTANTIEKTRLLAALNSVGKAAVDTFGLNAEISLLLQKLTEELGFDFATVSLLDEYQRIIVTTHGRNTPVGWVKRGKYPLDSHNIHADVVKNQKSQLIQGWDDRLDKESYELFGQENLARVFVPIIASNTVIGTVEAGCERERRDNVLSDEQIRIVEHLGREKGNTIAKARPYLLLRLIANHAIKIIGADSASIHVFQSENPFLIAGAGKATYDFLMKFPPRDDGIGRQAMETDKPMVIDDPQELIANNHLLYDEGVRSIAAFPLSIGEDIRGVVYVHFWQEHHFSQYELEIEQVFARQIKIAIQSNLLLQNIAEATERVWTLSGFQNILQSLVSTKSPADILRDVARNVLYMLDADNVTLYQYKQDNTFVTPPIIVGRFLDEVSLQGKIHPSSVLWRMVQEGISYFEPDTRANPLLSGHDEVDSRRQRFVEREEIVSTAALVLRAKEKEEIVGLMFVNYRTARNFNDEDQRVINALASSAAIAIKTAQLYARTSQELSRRDRELSALRAIDQAIVAGPPLPELQAILDLVLEKGLEIIGAPTGDIMWLDEWENTLTLIAGRGISETQRDFKQNVGEGIVGLVAQKASPILVRDVTEAKWSGIYKPLIPNTRSELAVPLQDESGILGVINVEHPDVEAFSKDDQDLLETLAVQAVIGVHIVNLYQKLEQQIQSLSSLSKIATRIQDPRYSINTILRMLLTGITAGEGLGFSRAMLFLINGLGFQLKGKIAVGAQTQEEADAIWKGLKQEIENLQEGEADMLTRLLDRAQKFSLAIENRECDDSALSLSIQKILLPFTQEQNSIERCILTNKSVFVKYDQPDPFRSLIAEATNVEDNAYAFACIPLRGKEKTIGVLVVDNRFLVRERWIDERLQSCLEVYAGVIAMSIENTELRNRLTEEQKLEAWKEFTGRIAHVIGTRITVIEGTVTQLRYDLFEQGTGVSPSAEEHIYVKDLLEGIRKAKFALWQFRRYSKPPELNIQELNLHELLVTTIRESQHSIKCRIEPALPIEPVIIRGDKMQLSDAFLEILTNAWESMEQNNAAREPRIILALHTERCNHCPQECFVQIEFIDNGPGVAAEDKKRLFDPFFSTKSKGGGLGLAIVKTTVEQHGGTIEEIGVPGEGAHFVICLPAS